MKIRLNFGYMDREDVVKDCMDYARRLDVKYEVEEPVAYCFAVIESQYRSELVKFTKRFLGLGTEFDNSDIADQVVDFNIVQ